MGRTATLAYSSYFLSTTAHSWRKRLLQSSVVAKVNICSCGGSQICCVDVMHFYTSHKIYINFINRSYV